jgi:23S rRNA pseudouridine1911/1915/1917 synthase
MQMAVFPPDSEIGKHAVTHYEVLERFGYVTLVRCVLETGRTHQIRVHMSYKGHPLLGDTVYGGMTTRFEKTHAKHLEGQCLFAKELSFRHPKTGEEMHFEVPLPDDFQFLLRVLREER